MNTVINLLANAVLAASVSGFMIILYRHESVVRRWPYVGSAFLRAALVLTACGAFGNCLLLSTPPVSEIILNVGLAGIFGWAVWFHHNLLNK